MMLAPAMAKHLPPSHQGNDEWAIIKKYIPYLEFFFTELQQSLFSMRSLQNPSYVLLLLSSLPSYIFFFTVVVC